MLVRRPAISLGTLDEHDAVIFVHWASRAVIWPQHVAAGFVAEPGPDIRDLLLRFLKEAGRRETPGP